MKIAVYAIAKNEIDNVDEWVANLKDADGIFVLDTGSTDGTPQRLTELGVHCNYRNIAKPFRFDHARNESLGFVPSDYDVCLSIDFDERLQPDWRAVLEQHFKGGIANYNLIFDYDEFGNVITAYPRCAIHDRHANAVWKYAAHEILTSPTLQAYNIPIMCVHNPKEQKAPGHYIELLKIDVVENPADARAHQYLAREFAYLQNWQQSLIHYNRHLELETYEPFRSETYGVLGQIAEKTGQDPEPSYYKAIGEFPYVREPFCMLANYYYTRKLYPAVIGLMERAILIKKPEINYIFREDYYTHWCHHMLFICYYAMNDEYNARLHMTKAFEACDGEVNQRLLADALSTGLLNVDQSVSSEQQ